MKNNQESVKEIIGLLKQKTTKRNWLTIRNVSELSTLSYSTIRRAVEIGELIKCKRPGKLLFHPDEVEKWLGR